MRQNVSDTSDNMNINCYSCIAYSIGTNDKSVGEYGMYPPLHCEFNNLTDVGYPEPDVH